MRFWPDPTIFEEIDFRAQTLLERFQMMAFLNTGLEIRFVDKRPEGNPEPVIYRYAGGIKRLRQAHQRDEGARSSSRVGYFEQAEEDQEVEIAFQWNTGYQTDGLHSFANGINTIEGGMHVEGFRKALTNVVNRYARAKGLLKEKDDNLQGEDIREGLTAIISVRLRDPQFEGQTKGKLGNVSMRSLVERATNEKLADWLEEHPDRGPQGGQQGGQRRRAPASRHARRARPRAASPPSRAPACPTSSRTAPAATPTSASCSSSRATPPVVRPCRHAIRAPRRSCPSAARS